MRLITFLSAGDARCGVLLSSGAALDLTGTLLSGDERPISTVADLLARGSGALARLRDHVASVEANRGGTSPDSPFSEGVGPKRMVAASELRLLPPMGANVLVVATSGNYLSHFAEMKMPLPSRAHGFIVSPNSLIGCGAAIRLPRGHEAQVDWEGEFCLVLGEACYRASPAQAQACIAGYTLFNDISARDWTASTRSDDPREAVAAWRNNVLFKQFPTFGPIGPAIVTVDECPHPENLELSTLLNGHTVQHDRIGAMQFSLADILSQLSEVYAFRPGDIVTTGTPAGVGFAQQPPRYLRAGDEVAVVVPGIGTLRNTIIRPD